MRQNLFNQGQWRAEKFGKVVCINSSLDHAVKVNALRGPLGNSSRDVAGRVAAVRLDGLLLEDTLLRPPPINAPNE